jgi:peptidoglycan/LPS O-acetylase OafA/YrhL
MYRGSRLAACFLLVLTGLAATAVALFVLPPAVADGAGRWLVPLAIAFALLHGAALVGLARMRDWGRNLAVFVAELGGGLAILGAIVLVTGAHPFGADSATGAGFLAWMAGVYAVLGIAAGRVPVVARLTPIERRRIVFGPSFAGMPHGA